MTLTLTAADGDALSQPLLVSCLHTSSSSRAGVSSSGSASPASMAQPAASRTSRRDGPWHRGDSA
jgi:hypothetical protein